MTTEPAALRSLLFTPGSDRRKLLRAFESDADAVIADLEDGVAPDEKVAARDVVEEVFAGVAVRRALRVNPPGTEWFEGDIELVRRLSIDFVVLPKALPRAVAALEVLELPVLAIVETVEGLLRAHETAQAGRVFALALGSHDLGAELRTTARPDGLELLHARSTVVVASAAAGLRSPFDTVYLDVSDADGLERECALARTLGLRGKLCIHPAQLDTVNRVFAPTAEELAWARRVVAAYEAGVREGRGAIAVDGTMVDVPVVRRAERLLAEAGV